MNKSADRIGQTVINNQGIPVTIIGYRDVHDIDVIFADGSIQKHKQYSGFLKGKLSSNLYPAFLGVGYLGIGKHKTVDDCGNKTDAYRKWSSMLTRCYSPKFVKTQNYQRCFVETSWLCFQNFAEWYYDNSYTVDEPLELDKDIRYKGNKMYASTTCLLLPHRLNTILCNRAFDRGECVLGVIKNGDKFVASCCDENTNREYIGTFTSEQSAFLAYKTRKEAVIKNVVEQYRGVVPNTVLDAVLKYKVEITD